MHAPSDEVAEDVGAETGRATAADISVSANASRPTRRTTRRRYISARAQHKASSAPCHADIYHQLLANVSFSAVRHSATTCARPLRANISAPPEKHRMSQRGAISRTLAINCCFRPASGKGGAHWADGDRAQIRTGGGSGGLGAAAAESSVYTISVRSRVGARVCEMRATGSRQGGRRPDRSELLSSSADTRGDDVSRRPTRPWPGDRRFVTNIAGRPRLQ